MRYATSFASCLLVCLLTARGTAAAQTKLTQDENGQIPRGAALLAAARLPGETA